ncbi:MAG: hypothetical protein ACREBU_26575, partial [Nitrososphaera sp.]
CNLDCSIAKLVSRTKKEWGSGPDNLWHVKGKEYWIISCKNMVLSGRSGISKSEVGQLSNDIAWVQEKLRGFRRQTGLHSSGSSLESDAFMDEAAWVITEPFLLKLKNNIINFFNSFQLISRDRITSEIVKQKLKDAHLDSDELAREYLQRISEAK